MDWKEKCHEVESEQKALHWLIVMSAEFVIRNIRFNTDGKGGVLLKYEIQTKEMI